MPVPDFSPGEVFTAAAADAIGLWLIDSGSLSLTTSASNVTDVFSSEYTNYRLLLFVTARSTNNRVDMKYIVGTTPTSTQYFQAGIASDYAANSTLYMQRSNNDNQFFGIPTTQQTGISMDIFGPNLVTSTLHSGHMSDRNSGITYAFGGVQLSTTNQYTGFQLFTNTGTATVKYQVFGYRD